MQAQPRTDLEPWQPLPDLTRDQIISWLYSRKDLQAIVKKITKNQYLEQELTSELFLYLCSKHDYELVDLYQRECIDFVIISWIKRQWHSVTSPFYNRIRKYELGKAMTPQQQQRATEILYSDSNRQEKEMYQDSLDRAIESLISPGEYRFFHRDIIKNYLELGTITAVSEKLRIRPEHISQALQDAKDMLKGKITDEVQKYLNNKIL